MAFDRQPMEQILGKMIGWTQGVTDKLTDFSVGSRIRSLYESVAVIVEEFYDKVYRSNKSLIEDNIYSVIGFDAIPAMYSSGLATFSRQNPADQNYLISAGSSVLTKASASKAPLMFTTTEDAVLAIGQTSVDVLVVCSTIGSTGNILASDINAFRQKPVGIDSVTNGLAFTNGQDTETPDAQKTRFQEFMSAQASGTLRSVEYGAMQVKLIDVNGVVLERILRASAFELLPSRKGEIDLYLWNGVGAVSEALKALVTIALTGYYASDGTPVYGYKPAGVLVNLYSVSIQYVTIKLQITPETWSTLDTVKPLVEAEVARYFASLLQGQALVQTALEASIKAISGIYDVKLWVSTDAGATFNMDNVSTTSTQVLQPVSPIIYI